MSQQEPSGQSQQKFTKTKEQRAKDKANTDAWKLKQQEKKKKKQQNANQQKNVELDQKALQKAKRKQQKRLQRQQMLKQQKKQQTTTQVKKQQKKIQQKKSEPIKQSAPLAKKQSKKLNQPSAKVQKQAAKEQTRKLSKDKIPVPQTLPKPSYTQLLSLQHHLKKSYPLLASINKSGQSQLIHKYLDQYVNANDTVLVLSRFDTWHPSSDKCTKRVFLYPNHQEFIKNTDCQNITCTYEDVAYLMEGTITKIFIEFDMLFANGVGLTQKGNENIICLANEYKIPVIGFSGTWNFNGWNFLSQEMFINKYGQSQIQKYDIIENDQIQIIVLQIGSVIPKQISGHLQTLSKIYRGCDLNSLKW